MILRIVAATAIALLAVLPAASAQEQAAPAARPPQGGLEALLHGDTLFRGQLQSVRVATPTLDLAWDVRSIRVRSGEWQICTGRNYTGSCTTIDRDQPTLGSQFRRIQSIRPTGGFGTGIGDSLRGANAEFFPAPMRSGQRIECSGSSCARSEANAFCRSVGWVVARSQGLETVNGRSVVADVLCARNIL